jgi:hypothetical protein
MRNAVPQSARKAIYHILPARVRRSVVRQVRPPDPLQLQLQAAAVDADATPLSVRTANLDRVVEALDDAGVPYFRVQAAAPEHTALGVPASLRPRVERLLAGLGAHLEPVFAEMVPSVLPPAPEPAEPVEPVEQPAEPTPAGTAVFWPVTDPGRLLLLGAAHACHIEFWPELADRLVAPRYNLAADTVLHTDAEVEAEESAFGDFRAPGPSRRYRTRTPLLTPPLDHIDFPIDVVYTWVDGADPAWLARKNAALAENGWVTANETAANNSRYVSRNELRYSLRSLHMYAPWVRRIFLVTDDQVPEWLNTGHPRITVVSHKEIFGGKGRLPTFNSHAIETRLHHIDGLSEHFIYTNDDVFFGQPLLPSFFFTGNGHTRIYLSRHRVDCGPLSPGEPPVMSAGKNNRAIIEREFGRFLAFKIKHTPHAARRSVLAEIEERCAGQIAETAAHQFRHPGDISMLSSLQQHWSYATGRAVFGDVRYMYRDLSDPITPKRLAATLRKRQHQLFCLNDTDADEASALVQTRLLAEFLPAYFPFRSPFELPDETGPGSARPSAPAG